MSDTILPCPFCGKAPSVGTHSSSDETGEDFGYSYCECTNCSDGPRRIGGPTRFVGVHAGSEKEAVRVWNRRALLSQSPEGMVMVPREPSGEMVKAGLVKLLSIKKRHGIGVASSLEVKAIFQAMIAVSSHSQEEDMGGT